MDRFWNDLKTDRGLSVEPRYVELAFGCPPIEWDIDARVRDFAERMGDEYTSLYEQDTTGIKGGDFERFGLLLPFLRLAVGIVLLVVRLLASLARSMGAGR